MTLNWPKAAMMALELAICIALGPTLIPIKFDRSLLLVFDGRDQQKDMRPTSNLEDVLQNLSILENFLSPSSP